MAEAIPKIAAFFPTSHLCEGVNLQYGPLMPEWHPFSKTASTSLLQVVIEDEGIVLDNGPAGSGKHFLLSTILKYFNIPADILYNKG